MKVIFLILALMASRVSAGPISLLISIDKTSYMTDLQAKLAAAGIAVDIFNMNTSNTAPTLAQLQNFKSVLVWTSVGCFFSVCTTLGNNLDQYARAGGGVVIATFGSDNGSSGAYEIAGAFLANDDWAIEPGPFGYGTELTLGTVHQLGSPLLRGVGSFDGGSSTYYSGTTVNAASTTVVDWSNGVPLEAYRTLGLGTVVSLNVYPISSDKFSTGWKSNTDGAVLMANALEFAGGVDVTAVPEPAPALLIGVVLAGLWLVQRRWRW